jgi:hypothetical protein
MEDLWNVTDWKAKVKTASVPFFHYKFHKDWDRSQAAVVSSWQPDT